MSKETKKSSDHFLDKVILETFQDWEGCRPGMLYVFLDNIMGFSRNRAKCRIFNYIDQGMLELDLNWNMVRKFKPKGNKKSLLSLEIESRAIQERMVENKGFLSEKDLQNLKKDTRLGKETRRLLWYLVREEKVVITWDSKIVLICKK